MSRTKHGWIEIHCDGCPNTTKLGLTAENLVAGAPTEGWAHGTLHTRKDGQIEDTVFDFCPLCVAAMPAKGSVIA